MAMELIRSRLKPKREREERLLGTFDEELESVSDRTVKLLVDKVCFPNVSEHRRRRIKASIMAHFRDTGKRPAENKDRKFGSYFDTERPVYSEHFVDPPRVEVGEKLDVLKLLGDSRKTLLSYSCTTKGVGKVRIDISGKYLMICCVFVPSIWSSRDGRMVYHTALASHELAGRDDFQLLVVPMMRKGFDRSYPAYESFLSAFSCLAVHFMESRQREYICSALRFNGELSVLILDLSQKVVYHGQPDMFLRFGGGEHDCFPFTLDRQVVCSRRDLVLDNRSLNDLLGCDDSDRLYNIGSHHEKNLTEGGGRDISISGLKRKLVALYLCSDCRSLHRLVEVHKECGRELEIVVVCCPFWDQVHPKLHKKIIIRVLARLKQRGWWLLPFNNTVSHRLQRMCEQADSGQEGLFMVNPAENCVDPYGFQIIKDFGKDAYPFTRRGLVVKEFQRMRGLRLSTLLHAWTCVCVSSSTKEDIPVVAKLQGKRVVLYMYKKESKDLAGKLGEWYTNNIKGKASNVEVVAVCLDVGTIDEEKEFTDMGWLVCRADPIKSDELWAELFHPAFSVKDTVVAFGEDGHIQSFDASNILTGPAPPRDNLRKDIRLKFYDSGHDYMRGFGFVN